MNVSLENIGKKYQYHWVFRNLTHDLRGPLHFGITGNNGSGKSTLLKIISGYNTPSEGKIRWSINGTDISANLFRFVGLASPHQDIYDEFSLEEIIDFHKKFKQLINGENSRSLIRLSGLTKSADKPIKYFSSGMKQRVKIVLAMLFDNPLVILDEPCSNFDEQAIVWYQKIVEEYAGEKLLVIGSNSPETECFSCKEFIHLSV